MIEHPAPRKGPRRAGPLPRMRLVESVETATRPARPSREDGLGPALSAIARAVGESMSLKNVLSRVAEAARLALPFDTMGVNVTENFDLPPDAMPEDESFSAARASAWPR